MGDKEAACDQCRIIGPWEVIQEPVDEGVKVTILEMEKCGHRFASLMINDEVEKKQEKVKKIKDKAQKFVISGDESGFNRMDKKYRAAQLSVKDAMRRLWDEYGDDIDAEPTDSLAG